MATQLRPQPPVAPMLDASEIANIRTNFRVLHDRLVLLQDEYDRLLLREQRRLDAEKADTSHVHDTADITTGTFADALVAESNVTQHVGAIDHDSLLNFVGAEHIDWSVTGAEDVHADRIAAGAVTQHEGSVNHDNLSGFVGNEHIDHTAVSVATAATSGLSGGGDISATRNLVLDLTALTAMTTPADADAVGMYDDGVGQRKITWANIKSALQSSLLHNDFSDYAVGQHRTINDAGTGTTDLFSASEIISRLAAKATAPTSEDSIIAGADGQGNYPVTATFLHVATVDATGKSITLPAVSTTGWHFLANDGANSMNIYPASGEYINAEAQNAAVALAAGGRAYFAYQSSGKWRMVTL